MNLKIVAAAVAMSAAAAACSQGSSDNVMAPEANALEPAEVNAVLGPEGSVAAEANNVTNDANSNAVAADNNVASDTTVNNSAE